jgi:hypothetical protein
MGFCCPRTTSPLCCDELSRFNFRCISFRETLAAGFWGGVGAVTGSKFLTETAAQKIIVPATVGAGANLAANVTTAAAHGDAPTVGGMVGALFTGLLGGAIGGPVDPGGVPYGDTAANIRSARVGRILGGATGVSSFARNLGAGIVSGYSRRDGCNC